MDFMKLAVVEAWKGERMYWDLASDDDRQLHLSRYELARELFQPDWDCLDAACGSGYGAAFLAEKARSVCGIDVNESAIEYARTRYSKPNLTYRCADLQRELPFADGSFDAITSFETLEHVRKQERMLSEFRRVLKPHGILVMSTPDRKVSERIGGLDNHFHVAELSKREFVELLSRSFSVDKLFGHADGSPVPSHWRAVHQLLRLGTRLDFLNMRPRIERALARPFAWLRSHFYQMSGSPIQPVTDLDAAIFVYVIAVARRSD
jgi:ubiquinone/menaquinone biosynthesis C-methylase UbiE